MTESRDLLMVTYDFIRLFRNGQIKSNDISVILQDIQNTYEILSFFLSIKFLFFSVFQWVIIHMILNDNKK
jgi:hypothetical protein